MPLHHVLRDVGVAVSLSIGAAYAFGVGRERNYLVGTLIGIPSSAFIAGSIPWVIGAPIGGAYLGSLAGYAAARALGGSPKSVERATVGAAIVGAVFSYL